MFKYIYNEIILNFLYNNSNLIVGPVVVALFVGVGIGGLWLVHRMVPHGERRNHNEFVGFMVAVVSVVYAVLLAFIAIAVWESFGKAGELATKEASLAGDVARDALTMPEPLRTDLLVDLDAYLIRVAKVEWKAMADGKSLSEADEGKPAVEEEGWELLFSAHDNLVGFHTSDPVQVSMFAELLTRLNSLYDARRDRLLATEEHLQGVVWGIVLLGAFFTIGFTYLFGMESFRMHALMTSSVAATVALVVLLIIAFDYPFRGKVQISPEAFQHVHVMLHKYLKNSSSDESENNIKAEEEAAH